MLNWAQWNECIVFGGTSQEPPDLQGTGARRMGLLWRRCGDIIQTETERYGTGATRYTEQDMAHALGIIGRIEGRATYYTTAGAKIGQIDAALSRCDVPAPNNAVICVTELNSHW